MIVRPGAPAIDLERFQMALRQAARGVLRCNWERDSTSSMGTAWCITDDLVVVPLYLTAAPSSAKIMLRGVEGEYSATIVERTGIDEVADVAVLRLDRPIEGAGMPLAMEQPLARTSVWMVHYPRGNPRAMYSFGSIVEISETAETLMHDVSSEPGSGGAPLLDLHGRVVGVHIGQNFDRRLNTAPMISVWLRRLRPTAVWQEIADYHRLLLPDPSLTTVGPAPQPSPLRLLRFAVQSRFDPSLLAEEERAAVKPHVVDANAPVWTLDAAARRSALEAAGAVEAMLAARGSEPASQPGQAVIDRILRGPPLDLWSEPLAALPQWQQALRWFAGLVPDLPTPAAVQRVLMQRRARERFRKLAGATFRGRADELRRMEQWFVEDGAGPLVIYGVGGIGKSALVARFADLRPPETLVIWLDFDRADLAPDDATSILRTITGECAAQLEGFTISTVEEPGSAGESWEVSAARLGAALADAFQGKPPPLMILDSFEIAQHAERYQELWPVLGRLLASLPQLRIIVAGRGTLTGLDLVGRIARPMLLPGLSAVDADSLLAAKGVTTTEVRQRLVELAHGIPLILMLGVHLLDAGGDPTAIPATLPNDLIEGYLYDRILDRVVDPTLKPLARGVLVLRRVTVETLTGVLAELRPSGHEPAEVFARLRREMALVDGDAVLRVRPEVRAASLRMIETEDAAFVRRIDEAAAAWYATQPQDDGIAAELVYHRLRLGDLHGAGAAWRPGSGDHLRDVEDTLPDIARHWLGSRLGTIAVGQTEVEGWEQDALRRVRELLGRGLTRGVAHVLAERHERTPDSPLVFYDAWSVATLAGNTAAALAMVADDRAPTTPVLRDRAVLRAWLQAKDDRVQADRTLQRIIEEGHPTDEDDIGDLVSMAISAARIHLTFEIEDELSVLTQVETPGTFMMHGDAVRRVLSVTDVVERALRPWFERSAVRFDSFRGGSFELGDAASREEAQSLVVTLPWLSMQAEMRMSVNDLMEKLDDSGVRLLSDIPASILRIALAARHRWHLLTTTPIAARIDRLAMSPGPWRMLTASLAYTNVCLFDTPGWPYIPTILQRRPEVFMADYLSRLIRAPFAHGLVGLHVEHMDRQSGSNGPKVSRVDNLLIDLLRGTRTRPDKIVADLRRLDGFDRYELHLTTARLLPDPLQLLVEHLAGIPDQ